MCYVLRDKSGFTPLNAKTSRLKAGNLTGFTLFELMVAIAMIVLLLTMSSVVYRNTNKRTELIFTAHQIAAMGRLAESYAASAKESDNITGQNIWGLNFKAGNQQVILFVDKNNNQRYDSDGQEAFRVLALPRQIKIWKIFRGQEPNEQEITEPNGEVVILYSPPDPRTKLCDISAGSCTTVDVVRVVFKDDANDSVKNIRFNFFGLIDVR